MRKLLFAVSTALVVALAALPAASARIRTTPPSVVTGSATAVTETSASIGGTVTPNGAPTRYWFEYGTSTSYGFQTPVRSAGAGMGGIAVAANLHRLAPGTVYHFRLDASNSAGTVEGADATFTTGAQSAPTAVTGSATAVGEHSASVGGTVDPNGQSTTYWFEYGTSTSYGSQTPSRYAGHGLTNVTAAAQLRGLTPGTLYHFRLDAQNAAGTVQGPDATFTTTAAALPAVVTGSASGVSEHSASLGGTVNPDGQPTHYWFEYGTSTSYGSHSAMRSAGSGSSPVAVAALLRGLTPGTLYHFRLDASNSAGTVDGADATFTTAAASLPAVVTGSATGVTEHSASVGGTVNPNGQPTRYWFEYGSSTGYGRRTAVRYAGRGSSPLSVAAALRGLAPGTVYHFQLDARNAAGTVDGADATFTTAAASAPGAVTDAARAIGDHGATVGGTVTPNGARTRYWFEYGTSTSYGQQTRVRVAGRGLGPLTVATRLRGLSPATLYHFRLDAQNSAGTTQGVDETFTTAAAPPPHQWFAGSVTAVGSDSLTVGVSWTGPHDGSLDGQTLTVAVSSHTRINQAPHNAPIALAQIQPNDLVALNTTGQAPDGLTALRIKVSCDCHWVGGTISGIDASAGSLTVQVKRTGPYDGVLNGQNVTIQTNADTVYMHGSHKRRIDFADLQVGEGVGVVFAANGFFEAPGFNWQTATFTAKRVHVWGHGQVPDASSDSDLAASTSVPG